MMLKIGDWVYCVNPHEYVFGWLGYIEWIRPPECKVIFVRTQLNQQTLQSRRMLLSRLKSAGMSTDWTSSELDELIDLALDTRDEEWFLELAKRMEGIKRNGSERSSRKEKAIFD